MGSPSERLSLVVSGSGSRPSPLLVLVAALLLAGIGLYLAHSAGGWPLTAGLFLLSLASMGSMVGALRAHSHAQTGALLATSALAALMLGRVFFLAGLPPVHGKLLLGLVSFGALLAYIRASGAGDSRIRVRARDWSIALGVGAPLGATLGLMALLVTPSEWRANAAEGVPLAVAAGLIALVDEVWFRGILQPKASACSRPLAGWLVASALFVAFGAYAADPVSIALRVGIGCLLGILMWHTRSLPLALATRVAFAAAVVFLAPPAFDSALIT